MTKDHLRRLVLLSGGLALAGACAPDQPTKPTEAPELEASAAAARYTIVDLGVLANGRASVAYGVNRLGWVVGQSKGRAFIWKQGVMRDLGSLGGKTDAGALAINGNGDVVGTSRTALKQDHATLWRRNGAIVDLGVLSGGNQAIANSRATDVNEAGQVVGFSQRAGGGRYEAFLWENGVMKRLFPFTGQNSVATAINATGQVVGYALGGVGGGDAQAFIWENGVRRDLGTLGGSFSNAQGINGAGHVVGSSQTADGSEHGYIWKDGVMTDIGTLGGGFCLARDINAKDQIVGESSLDADVTHAFIWEQGVMRDLGSLSYFSFAEDINAAGQIAGWSLGASEKAFPRATFWKPN